ncbi:glycoside hydrolase 43 family protein [Luteolibacter sp. LG18]|uniref:glycoside hydrolase family 43 protein n=1 Tax=Luteolibacter sp. LG18 TaxID=2819286 RepID=UPI002B2B39CA|nr:beta-xylosidase [Luteolibacter sp. LG18]
MSRLLPVLAAALCSAAASLPAHAWQSDNGDGTFTNPPLYADYPDPDVIRVGDDFYFVTTTFANSPGLRILHSKDLVNWEILGHVVERLEGSEKFDLKNGNAYRGGIFAPSIRHRGGVFYVVVTPVGQNTRIYQTKDPKGPWTCHELDRPAFDPGFFIDDDGKGYIITSGGWDGTATLLTLNEDYTKVTSEEKVHFNKGAEGSKLVKRGGWYYLFNAIPGRLALTVSRAKSLHGPWETREQIDDRTGGHQGAIVDLPDGRDFGFVMIDNRFAGRMTNFSPVFWEDGWPVWGTKEAPGKVPERAEKPVKGGPVMQPATSDTFNSATLGVQWEWNHNPDTARWSLIERPGFLRLHATEASTLWTARNTLTQKGQGPWSRGDVKLDLRNLKPGDTCGFGTFGKVNGHIAVTCGADGALALGMQVIEDTTQGQKTDVRVAPQPFRAKEVFLRTELDFKSGKAMCAYSLDAKEWKTLGGEFDATYDWQTGTFQGPQFALFCFNPKPGAGFVDVDAFRFSDQR